MFKLFSKEIETRYNKRIKCFHSDRGTEYESHTSNKCYKELENVHETIAPYSPEMNGNAKRKNRTFTELLVAIMLNSGATPHWWGKFY